MPDPALFAQSLLIGLSIAAPVGPIGLLVIQRSLQRGARVGLATGLGAAVADALYGGAPAAGLTRQALHARRLAFAHPITGQALDFSAPLPADLAAALLAWGLTMPADDEMTRAAAAAR